jgi:hypothetical protein
MKKEQLLPNVRALEKLSLSSVTLEAFMQSCFLCRSFRKERGGVKVKFSLSTPLTHTGGAEV